MIVLFDIDGTLTTGSGCGRVSLEHAFEVELAEKSALRDVSLHGNTDWCVVEFVAKRAGCWPDEQPARRALVDRILSRYREAFARAVPGMPYRPIPGAREMVEAAKRACGEVGLATGNVEACGHGKLASAGLGDLFAGCVGGYGDEAETRAGVVALAIERARGRGASGEVWLVGDTPLDVSAGHLAGARVAGVATGSHGMEVLREARADAVYPDLHAVLATPPWK